MKQTIKHYFEFHPFLAGLLIVSFGILAFAPISAGQGALVDYNELIKLIVGLWFVSGLAYFMDRMT